MDFLSLGSASVFLFHPTPAPYVDVGVFTPVSGYACVVCEGQRSTLAFFFYHTQLPYSSSIYVFEIGYLAKQFDDSSRLPGQQDSGIPFPKSGIAGMHKCAQP